MDYCQVRIRENKEYKSSLESFCNPRQSSLYNLIYKIIIISNIFILLDPLISLYNLVPSTPIVLAEFIARYPHQVINSPAQQKVGFPITTVSLVNASPVLGPR